MIDRIRQKEMQKYFNLKLSHSDLHKITNWIEYDCFTFMHLVMDLNNINAQWFNHPNVQNYNFKNVNEYLTDIRFGKIWLEKLYYDLYHDSNQFDKTILKYLDPKTGDLVV